MNSIIWEQLYIKKLICVHRSHLVPDKHPLTSIFAAFFLSTNCFKSSWVENGDYYSLSRLYLGPNVKVRTHLTLYRRDYRIVLIHSTFFLMSALVSNVLWSFFISPFPLLSFSSLSLKERSGWVGDVRAHPVCVSTCFLSSLFILQAVDIKLIHITF